jgi:HemY protein
VRAKKLQSIKQNNAESALLVARAALDAGDTKLAREQAESAVRMDVHEGAFLLLADIEEAESGDQGRIRQYLARAVRAPRDPAWVADGVISDKWAPASPVTGRLDAFEWRAPVERVAALIEQDEDFTRPLLPASAPAVEEPAEDLLTSEDLAPEPVAAAAPAAKPVEAPPATKPAEPAATSPAFDPANANAPAEGEEDETPHLPDDPGVDPKEAEERETRRFRLF